NAGPINVTTPCAPVSAPYTENFDATTTGSTPPACWANEGPGELWQFQTSGGSGPDYGVAASVDHTSGSGRFAWLDGSGNVLANGLVTPFIDISGLTQPEVHFWRLSNNTNEPTTLNPLRLEAWDGSTWVLLNTYSGNNPAWVKHTEFPMGLPSITRFRLVVTPSPTGSQYYNDILVDDFSVVEAPLCLTPGGLAGAAVGTTGVSATWNTEASAVNGYVWEVRTSGNPGDPGAIATGTTGTTSFSTTSGILANTSYQIYVRSDCDVDGVSTWAGPVTVYTGYCVPGPNTSLDDNGITNVTFANVNQNLNTEADGGYTDLSSVIGSIGSGGDVVPISVLVETGFTYDMRIWIDWNNDLDFDDAGELVAGGGTSEADGTNPWVTSFSIPPAQAAGNYRMRIGGADFGITGPCYAGSYRAFVDFTVSVCVPPTDNGTVVVEDCMAQTFGVSVTVDLGAATSATVNYSVNGVAQTPVAYTAGVVVNAAVHEVIDVTVVTNEGCSIDLGPFNSSCDIELDCGGAPIEMIHCYDNGDTRTWTWVNTEVGGTVSLKFISGSMDANDNILLWEGAVGGTPATPGSLTGTLDGILVTSVGNTLSMSIVTDGSGSCADGGFPSGWVFQARCGGCVEPSGFVTADPNELGSPEVNCSATPEATFTAYVGIIDNGIDGGTGLPPATVGYRLFVNNVAQPDVTGLPGGEYYVLGDFPLTTDLDVVLLHENESACNAQVATDFTVGYNACPPANDACANATVLTVNTLANCPANAVTGTTRGADQSGAQPSCAAGAVQDVWYAVDITGWATPRLSITDGTATVVGLELYNDCMTLQGYCSNDLTAFTYLNMNGLAPGVYYARVFTTVAGAGNFTICVSSPGPAGYECDGAINIPSVPVVDQAMVCTSEALPGLLNSTTVPAACGGASNSYKGGQEGLYTYTAAVSGDYTITYNGVDYSGIFVYSGACPTNGGVCVNSSSVGFGATTNTLTVPMVMGELYYIWFDTWPTPNSPCPGTFSIGEPVVPCAGVPDPGATQGPALACSGIPFTLSLQNATSGTGVSYAWESSTDGGMNWLPVGGSTETLSASITVETMFRCTVTCATGPDSDTSDPITVGIETNPANCPCVPTMTDGCTDDDVIARVQLNTLDNNTGITCPSGVTGYNDYTSNPGLTTTLQAGNSYNCTVTVGPWSEGIAVWIDYDDNGVFDHPAERVGFTSGTISAGASLTFPISLACNPPLGTHRMRVRARFATDGSTILPCEDGTYGETEDYFVTISAAVACPTPSGLTASSIGYDSADLTWNIGCAETEWELEYGLDGFALGSGTPVSVSGAPAHSLNSVLSPSTAYDVYVRANCDVDGFSTWFGPYSFTTNAAPPANDDCGGAIALTVNPDYACGVVTSATTGGATASPQPDDATGTPNDDVWFSFVATNSTHRISLINRVWVSGGTSSTDMGMAVYLGPCDDGGMIQVGSSDPETYNIAGLLIPGQTYYVRVYSWSSTARNINFDICVGTPPPPPANDNCAGAVALTVNSGLTCTAQTAGTVESATDSGVAVSPCLGTADDDVWYTFVASAPEHIVSLNGVAGSTTSMNFQVFSGACGGLTSIACGATGSAPSTTVSGLTPTETYYVRVYTNTATIGQNTTFNICVTTPPAGPPANDDCAGAYPLTVNAGQSCTANTFGTVYGATASADATTCTGAEDDDVWFSFVATGPAHTISLNSVAGSVTSMNFQVLSGTCGSLTSVVCSGTGSAPTAFASGLTAGNTYYVRVYTNTALGGQNTTFNVCVTSPPANDLCANAQAVACNSVTAGTTVGSSNTGNPGTCITTLTNTGVWYTVQGWGGPMVASLCGASFDTKMGVFTGSCGAFTCVNGNDDDQGTGGANVCGGGTASSTAWTSTLGTTYYIYVTSFTSGVTGTFNLTVTCGSTAASCPANGLNLEFQNDANPGQVTWQVLNADGNATVLSGADPIPANSIGTQALCLPDGCYRLRVLDSAGDGMTTGGYELRTSGMGERIIDNTNNFSTGSVSAIANGGTFCLPLGTVTPIWSSCDKLDWVNN
ncbi:MAG TPA: GEVED domain-containing protein, partial [Flavobacteriales bacterium]|nr:GEVED domain-containing protein [Flavobacteriales bacterium]